MTSEKSFIAIELKAKGHQSHGMASVCHTGPRRGPGLWTPPPGPSAPDQQLIKRQDGAAQGAKEPRVSEPFPRISKDPLGTHTPGGSGLASGRGRGKSSRSWGPWDGAPLHSHRRPPTTDGPEPGLLSHWRRRAVSYSGTIFGAQRKRKRKQRKELLFSVEPSPGKDSRACWAREGSRCGSKDPRLERTWRGAVVQGSQRGGHRWGTPGLVHTLGTH